MRYIIGICIAVSLGILAILAGFTVSYAIVAGLGAAVGAVELAGRYRYAPVRAVFTFSAFVYVFINLIAALAAYFILTDGGFTVAWNGDHKNDPAKATKDILVASFGAAFVMRSSLFRVKIGDGEVGIGPSAILDTLLLVADRGVDRAEAEERAQEVSRLTIGIHADRVADTLTEYALSLMQNVPLSDRIRIRKEIDDIVASKVINPAVKADVAALTLANIVGLSVLAAAVTALKDRASQGNPQIDPQAQQKAEIQNRRMTDLRQQIVREADAGQVISTAVSTSIAASTAMSASGGGIPASASSGTSTQGPSAQGPST